MDSPTLRSPEELYAAESISWEEFWAHADYCEVCRVKVLQLRKIAEATRPKPTTVWEQYNRTHPEWLEFMSALKAYYSLGHKHANLRGKISDE